MTAAAQDVITTKLERTFDTMDANHDGYLDWSDYQKLADRYIQAYKLDKNDRRARALVNFCQMYWLELLRHSGVDGDRLTKDQFVTANRLAVIDSSRLNVTEGGGHAIFDVIDVNGDNEISKDEFARFLRDVWKSDAPDAMDMFAKLDTDGDGAISRQEFIRVVREHFLSNDPDAPGSLFFGHV
ncbi:EF-hand domain-containing protein [Streptomyces griseoviridis]|uniref:Calcium-binding protein n=2 Tax=Streptomyces TaxID=1883 RepID=A0A3Q9KLZ5_STRGD|nr:MULTISPECIES: EF-hand domain-containing protein [Streptomyces]AZS83744.1 EF-hand domain-containing protein [Streptomyces griseoviridis]MDH6696589.1 Ca2+-binding EF-hand superfamily protein [Streptomyces sp. MAA16]MDT0473331.1 EF-hand domain-containing protein [Streptomyces sp. DSM 41014]QCN89404.1 calcium-binding protein [Streptomyces griseoviridis]